MISSKHQFWIVSLISFAVSLAIIMLASNLIKKERKNTKVKLLDQTKDIGTVVSNLDAHAEFVIVNIGEEDFFVDEIVPDCKCTTPNWSKSITKVKDTLKVKVQYSGNESGYFQQNVKVYCNVDFSPLILTLRGNVAEFN